MILNLDGTVFRKGYVNVFNPLKPLKSLPVPLQIEPLSEELAMNSTSYRGEIIVALKFVPPNASNGMSSGKKLSRRSSNTRGTLLILVKEAKNLISPKGTNIPDPFAKG